MYSKILPKSNLLYNNAICLDALFFFFFFKDYIMMHKILSPIVLKTKREVGPREFRALCDHDKACETKRSC